MPIPFLNSQSDRYVSLRFSKKCIAPIALSILLPFTAGTSLAQSLCSHQFRALQAETQITNKALNTNDFMIRRGLRTYSKLINSENPQSFEKFVSELSESSIWVDMGAGMAIALYEGLLKNSKISEGLAISLKKPKNSRDEGWLPGRLSYLHGDYVENMWRQGKLDPYLKKADLITDLYGPLSYSENLPLLFQIYFDLLRPGGRLMFNLMDTRSNPNYLAVLMKEQPESFLANRVTIDGKVIEKGGVIEWLRRIEGIKIDSIVENRSSNQFQFEESSGIVITKIKPRVVVPNNLELLEYDPMSPPRRDFRVVD